MRNIEIHIATPKLDREIATPRLNAERAQLVGDVLREIGFTKTKYFQGVRDLRTITPGCMNGHDLSDPLTMSTLKVHTIEEGVALVRNGMAAILGLGITGSNFEIERVMIPNELPGNHQLPNLSEFRPVPNSPTHENHTLYKGTLSTLPSDQDIENLMLSIGLQVNQIVDFTHDAEITPETIISRVATVYQPSHQAAAETDLLLRKSYNALGKPRIVTEQVLIVGEYN